MVKEIGDRVRILAVVLTLTLSVIGCADRVVHLTQRTLFSVAVGPLEDQLELAPGYEQAGVRLWLHSGIFHISNAPVRKVMRVSSFGDLLLLIYHPELNPKPAGLTTVESDTVSTRLARSYAIGPVGHVAADGEGTIYLQEQLDPESWESDGVMIRSHAVRRFDRTGEDLGYIGREGPTGSPFGFVEKLSVTDDGDLLVVTRDAESWQAFWFDREGLLRFRRRLAASDLQGSEEGPVAVEIVSVLAADSGPPHLLVEAVVEPSGRSALWHVDSDGVPILALAAPRSDGAPFRLIGGAGGWLFFAARANSEITLLTITDDHGRPLAQVELSLQDPTVQLSELQVSNDGVLYGARIGPERVEFLWWRTDLLIKQY